MSDECRENVHTNVKCTCFTFSLELFKIMRFLDLPLKLCVCVFQAVSVEISASAENFISCPDDFSKNLFFPSASEN